MKKSAEKAVKSRRQHSGGSDHKNNLLYDVFDDEEVYNMHERYEEVITPSGSSKPENMKRSFRNGSSGRGVDLKK